MLHDFTQDKFDVIIQAGQSNSEGYAFGNVDAPYQPDGRVWYLNQDGTVTLAAVFRQIHRDRRLVRPCRAPRARLLPKAIPYDPSYMDPPDISIRIQFSEGS